LRGMLNCRRKVLCVATTDRLFSKHTRMAKPRCVPVQTMGSPTEQRETMCTSLPPPEYSPLQTDRAEGDHVHQPTPTTTRVFTPPNRQSRGRPCAPAYHHHHPSIHPSKPLNLFCRTLYIIQRTSGVFIRSQ
jgi:hypothetical protein